jgi:lipopolysaccharide exporter
VFKATGRPFLLSRLTLIEFFATTPVVWLTALATRDLIAVALAMLIMECLAAMLRLSTVRSQLGIGITRTLLGSAMPLLAAAVMGLGIVHGVDLISVSNDTMRLALTVAAGILIYSSVLLLIDRRFVLALVKLMLMRS